MGKSPQMQEKKRVRGAPWGERVRKPLKRKEIEEVKEVKEVEDVKEVKELDEIKEEESPAWACRARWRLTIKYDVTASSTCLSRKSCKGFGFCGISGPENLWLKGSWRRSWVGYGQTAQPY